LRDKKTAYYTLRKKGKGKGCVILEDGSVVDGGLGKQRDKGSPIPQITERERSFSPTEMKERRRIGAGQRVAVSVSGREKRTDEKKKREKGNPIVILYSEKKGGKRFTWL